MAAAASARDAAALMRRNIITSICNVLPARVAKKLPCPPFLERHGPAGQRGRRISLTAPEDGLCGRLGLGGGYMMGYAEVDRKCAA